MNRSTKTSAPTVNALRHPFTVLNAKERRRDVLRRRLEGFAIGVASVAVALAIAHVPAAETDADVSAAADAQIRAETQKLAAQHEPCWVGFPMRTPITQENINRLCIKPLRPVPVAKATPQTILATKE